MQSSQQWVKVLVLQVAEELIMVLLPDSDVMTNLMAEELSDHISPSMKIMSNQVGCHVQSIRRDHVPSFR